MINDARLDPPAAKLFQYPLPDLSQKMAGQSELLVEFVNWAREMNAALAAHRALAQALIATHPDPRALLDHFQQGMDMVADVVVPDQVEDYRREMQLLHGLILRATHHQLGRRD